MESQKLIQCFDQDNEHSFYDESNGFDEKSENYDTLKIPLNTNTLNAQTQIESENHSELYSDNKFSAIQPPIPLLCSWPINSLPCQVGQRIESEENKKTSIGKGKSKRAKCIKKIELSKKKAIKKMRNRISAQESRDRKKKEFEDVKIKYETCNSELELLKKVISSLPAKAKEQFNRIKEKFISSPKTKTSKPEKLPPKISKNKKSPIIFTSLLVGCLLLATCLAPLVTRTENYFKFPKEYQSLEYCSSAKHDLTSKQYDAFQF